MTPANIFPLYGNYFMEKQAMRVMEIAHTWSIRGVGGSRKNARKMQIYTQQEPILSDRLLHEDR